VPHKHYEIIEHTADIGIRVKGKEMEDLFTGTALAMFDIIAEEITSTPSFTEKVVILKKADTPEDLLAYWLNELLSLSALKGVVFFNFKIEYLTEKEIKAVVVGRPVSDYRIMTEIKAATYHGLTVRQTQSGWETEVIFDV
jgi:SHS2 domain-containing protein